MNRHWNVRIPEIEGGQPVPLTYWQEHRRNGLPTESVTRPQGEGYGRGWRPNVMTSRSTTLRTEGCRSLEKGVEQAPEHPWQPRPRRYSLEQPLGWRWGWKKALGWEEWNMRSAEEGQTIAQPQQPYNPVSAPQSLQACQWRDREPPEKARKETAPTSWNPKVRKKEPTPRTPMKRLQPWRHRKKRSASRTVCHSEKRSQQGNPRRAASRKTPRGNRRCTKISRRNTTRRRSKSWQHP